MKKTLNKMATYESVVEAMLATDVTFPEKEAFVASACCRRTFKT